MTREVFGHRGRWVSVETFENGDKFGWEFQIDEERPVVLKVSAASDEFGALSEARAAAMSVIDLRAGPQS